MKCDYYINYIILANIFKEILSISHNISKVTQVCFITYVFQLY